MKMSDREKADVMIAPVTDGNYRILIETEGGEMIEVILTPQEFAKAVTGKLAKADVWDKQLSAEN